MQPNVERTAKLRSVAADYALAVEVLERAPFNLFHRNDLGR